MTAVESPVETIPYTRRQEVGTVLLQAIGDGERGMQYFDSVIRPNLLPEEAPSNLAEDVAWIGKKAKESIAGSTEALGRLLLRLLEVNEITAEDAVVCADALAIPCFYDSDTIDITARISHHVTAETEIILTPQTAVILELPQRIIEDSFGSGAKLYTFPEEVFVGDVEASEIDKACSIIVLHPEDTTPMPEPLVFRKRQA